MGEMYGWNPVLFGCINESGSGCEFVLPFLPPPRRPVVVVGGGGVESKVRPPSCELAATAAAIAAATTELAVFEDDEDEDGAAARRPCSVDRPLTCRHSAAFRKLFSDSWDTCTSPLYMNSSRADMFSAEVASRITQQLPVMGADWKRSAKCFEHAARISLCALNIVPGIIRGGIGSALV